MNTIMSEGKVVFKRDNLVGVKNDLSGNSKEKTLEDVFKTQDSRQQENNAVLTQTENSKVKRSLFKSSRKKWLLISSLLILVFSLIFINLAQRFIQQAPKLLGKKGEIVWWGVNEEESTVYPLIQEFQQQNPDVRIVYQKQSKADYVQRLLNSFKKGDGPDIFELHVAWKPDFGTSLATMPSNVMSESDYTKTFLPPIVAGLQTSGGVVGFPLYYDALTLYINENIFSSARVEIPKTWDDIVELSDPKKGQLTISVKKGDLTQSAIALGTTNNVDNWQEIIALMLIQNGVNPGNLSSARAQDVFRYYYNFAKSGVWNERQPNSLLAFSRGSLAMCFGTVSSATKILKENKDLRFRTIEIPQLPKNLPTDPEYSYASYWFHAVWDKSTNKDYAWNFLKFLSDKESIKKLNNSRKSVIGIELPPPRNDMILDYDKHPLIAAVLNEARLAKSWFVAYDADDGEDGVNSLLSKYLSEFATSGLVDEKELAAYMKIVASFRISTK